MGAVMVVHMATRDSPIGSYLAKKERKFSIKEWESAKKERKFPIKDQKKTEETSRKVFGPDNI